MRVGLEKRLDATPLDQIRIDDAIRNKVVRRVVQMAVSATVHPTQVRSACVRMRSCSSITNWKGESVRGKAY